MTQAPTSCEPYEITLRTETQPGPLSSVIGADERRRCVELPEEIDSNVRALATRIQGDAADTPAKLEAVRRYLWANHQYSLLTDAAAGIRIANFLLEKKSGHCQYFASAAVMLLRCMKVPARYVTGFYVHESPEDDVAIVRLRDAHAWVEVWTEDAGWVTFDPTPPGGMPGQDGSLAGFERVWDRVEDWASAIGAWLREDLPLKAALALAAVFTLLMIWRYVLRNRAARADVPQILYDSTNRAMLGLARTFDAYLQRRGAACPAHRTWALHLDALAQAGTAEAWQAEREFVREYSALRFGGGGDERIKALREMLDKMNEQQC
jgi:hypothetical protein